VSSATPPRLAANANEETVSIDYSKIIAPVVIQDSSPIDLFYEHCRRLIVRSDGVDEWLLGLLVLDLISGTETYIRRVLSGAINVCARCRTSAAGQQLTFGAASYYRDEEIALALLESALSGEGGVKKKIAALTGFEVKAGTSVASALAAFDRVCQLRHAIVHSHGELNYRNLTELELRLDLDAARQRIQLSAVSFQPLVVLCRNTVRALNNMLYVRIIDRWIDQGDLIGDWAKDRARVEPLVALLVSAEDMPGQTAEAQYASAIKLHIDARNQV